MKLSACLVHVGYLVGAAFASCTHDNCYRSLFPSSNPGPGLSFCQSYTTQINTATTGFAPQFTAACGTSPSKYSSACSCAPTSTSAAPSTVTSSAACTPTPTLALQNGDFECGIYPWRALVTNGTIYSISLPGSSSAHAFRVDNYGPIDSVGLGQATVSQLQYISAETTYTLSFDSFWSPGGGFIGVKLNGQPEYTVDALDKNGPGVWNSNSFQFTTGTARQYLFEFEFFMGGQNTFAEIDNVALNPGL